VGGEGRPGKRPHRKSQSQQAHANGNAGDRDHKRGGKPHGRPAHADGNGGHRRGNSQGGMKRRHGDQRAPA